MPNYGQDLTGKTFAYIFVEGRSGNKTRHGNTLWRCRCICGTIWERTSSHLLHGNTKSCGCKTSELKSIGHKKHGDVMNGKSSFEYSVWNNMKQRCFNPNHDSYKYYGGRGICVCDRWANSFSAFLEDMGRAPTSKHSIDRFPDKSGNYEPGNARWATKPQQANNMRSNRIVSYEGNLMTLAQLAGKFAIKQNTLHCRLKSKSIEEAVALPVGPQGKYHPTRRASTSIREMAQLPLFAGEPSGAAIVNSQ